MAEDRGGSITVDDAILDAGFVQVPMLLMEADDLGAGAKFTYGILLRYHWEGMRYPGHAATAERFALAERTLRRYLSELEDAGVIEVERPGLGETNSYHLPSLSAILADQGGQYGQSRRPSWPNHNNDSDSVLDSNEKTKGAFRLSFDDKTALIEHLHDIWDNDETPLQSRLTLLRPWSLEILQEAAKITMEQCPPDVQPFAYLYGILKRQPVSPAKYVSEEPLTDEEFAEARRIIDEINAEMGWDGK